MRLSDYVKIELLKIAIELAREHKMKIDHESIRYFYTELIGGIYLPGFNTCD